MACFVRPEHQTESGRPIRSASPSSPRHDRRLSSSNSTHPGHPALADLNHKHQDGGVQEPDAIFDDYYYPEGAYYYTEAADDQE